MTYKYLPSSRFFMAICIPICTLIAISSWFFNQDGDNHFWLALIFSIFFGIGALARLTYTFMSFNWVRLDSHSFTTRFFRSKNTIFYWDIKQIEKTATVINVHTKLGRFRIDSNIENSNTIYAQLQHHAFGKVKENASSPPASLTLPYLVLGARVIFSLYLFLGLIMLLFTLILLSAFVISMEDGMQFSMILFGLVFSGIGTVYFFHNAFWILPKSIHFDEDQIILQHFGHKKIFYAYKIRTAHIETKFSTETKQPTYTLVIYFNDYKQPKLELKNEEVNIHVFQIMDLMTRYYRFKPMYKKVAEKISPRQFSVGARRPFPEYFQRESQVSVTTITDICDWLKTCKYEQDREQFNAGDYWLHPVDFEQIRQGDCEDHALWAWRKIAERNGKTEFIFGYRKDRFMVEGYHTWVTYRAENGRAYLVETTAKIGEMVFPLEEKEEEYHPLFSVDQSFKTYRY